MGKLNSNSHHIAKEDISCFKVVEFRNDIIRSVYQDWNIYTLGRKEKRLNPLVKIKHFYSDDKIFEIHRGFHSYSDDCKIVVYNGMFQYFQIEYSSIMLDIFIPSIKSSRYYDLRRMNCIIPKGSEYYINQKGEIVSDCIIPISIDSSTILKKVSLCVG